MADDDSKIRRAAENAAIVLISRLSGPALLGVCSYIAVSVVNLKTELAQLTGNVNASIQGIAARIDNLENWRNNLDSAALEGEHGRHAN